MLSAFSGPRSPGFDGVGEGEHRRQDREVLRHVVRDRERRQRSASDQELFADLDDLDQLGRVRVEVDHVAGLLGGGRPRVHGDTDVGLRQRGGVVRAVAGHRDHAPVRLLVLDQRELRLRGRLGEEVVDAGFLGDHGGGHAVVAGDHHRANPHAAELVEALVHAALDDVLEMDDAEREVVACDHERGPTLLGDLLDRCVDLGRRAAAVLGDERLDGVRRTLADHRAVHVHAAHARGRAEGDELVLSQLALAQVEAFLREHDDRPSFGCLVGE